MTPGSVVVGYLDGGTWSACFGLSYRDMLLYDASHNRRIIREGGKELRAVSGSGQLGVNRNKVARDFLDGTDAEWLLFIDSDMGFDPDTADRLVAAADPADRPVAGALCFAVKRVEGVRVPHHGELFEIQPTLYEFVELEDEAGFRALVDYPRGELVRVDATGAACLLIHRSVLERVRAEIGDVWFDSVPTPDGLRQLSEDFSFCMRLRDLGVPLHVDTSVKTAHHKGVFFLDEDAFDRQQALVQLAEVHLGARR